MVVDKKELGEIACDEPAASLIDDLLMALAEDNGAGIDSATYQLRLLAKAKYYELSGQAAEDDAHAKREHDDYVASVHFAATR